MILLPRWGRRCYTSDENSLETVITINMKCFLTSEMECVQISSHHTWVCEVWDCMDAGGGGGCVCVCVAILLFRCIKYLNRMPKRVWRCLRVFASYHLGVCYTAASYIYMNLTWEMNMIAAHSLCSYASNGIWHSSASVCWPMAIIVTLKCELILPPTELFSFCWTKDKTTLTLHFYSFTWSDPMMSGRAIEQLNCSATWDKHQPLTWRNISFFAESHHQILWYRDFWAMLWLWREVNVSECNEWYDTYRIVLRQNARGEIHRNSKFIIGQLMIYFNHNSERANDDENYRQTHIVTDQWNPILCVERLRSQRNRFSVSFNRSKLRTLYWLISLRFVFRIRHSINVTPSVCTLLFAIINSFNNNNRTIVCVCVEGKLTIFLFLRFSHTSSHLHHFVLAKSDTTHITRWYIFIRMASIFTIHCTNLSFSTSTLVCVCEFDWMLLCTTRCHVTRLPSHKYAFS